jgi:MFS family permease
MSPPYTLWVPDGEEVELTEAEEYRDKRWIALALLCMAQFMVVLDASIVNVALVSIGEALKFSPENLSWVVNAYVLTFGGFLLLGGRLGDLWDGGASSSPACCSSPPPRWWAASPSRRAC